MDDDTTHTSQTSEKALADEILRDAQRKADRARTRAERETAKIQKKTERDAQTATARTLELAQERGERLAQAVLATLEAEAQRELLAAREGELDKLFEQARQRLADKGGYDYPAVLAVLAAQAIEAMAAPEVVLELNDGDRAIATEAWLADLRGRVGREVAIAVADGAAPIDGGLIARSADGRLLYDNSFAARLERLRPDLRRQLATRLFGEGVTRDA